MTQTSHIEGLPDLPYLASRESYVMHEVVSYARAHGLACYEAGRASHAAPIPSVDAVVGEPVAWLRDQRGEYEGRETLDPLFILGSSRPTSRHGATYSPLAASVASRAQTEPAEMQGHATMLRAAAWIRSLPAMGRDAPYWTNGVFANDCTDAAEAIDAAFAAAPTPTQVAEAPKAVPQAVVGEASEKDDRLFDLTLECVGRTVEVTFNREQISALVERLHAFGLLTPSPAPRAAPQEADALREALLNLINVIEAASVSNLSRGVELGPVVWSVKCNDAIAAGLAALAQHQPQQGEQQ